jgi:pilus assembly protein CpaF
MFSSQNPKSSRIFEETALFDRDMNKTVATGGDIYQVALNQVRTKLSSTFSPEELGNAGPKVTEYAKVASKDVYVQFNTAAARNNSALITLSVEEFIDRATSDLLGMGALETLLKDPSIEDIAVNGPSEVMLFRHGAWERSGMTFDSPERLQEILNRGVSGSQRQVNMVNPIVDAILPGGQRVSVVTYPITDTWPSAVVRIQRTSGISLMDMVAPYKGAVSQDDVVKNTPLPDYLNSPQGGVLSGPAAAYLHAAVLAGLNIVVVGPTGVGKTTLLTALGRCVPKGQRMLIIEDTPEIKIHPNDPLPNNILYLRTRESNLEGVLPVTQERLVKLALRQRPDALTLGEARGAEVFDLLNALKTGHKNGLTSLHAEDYREIFERIYLMLSQSERGRNLSSGLAAKLVATSLHIVISLELVGRVRRVQAIAEFTGNVVGTAASPEPEMSVIFQHTGHGGSLGKPLRESVFGHRFLEAPE